MASFNTVRFLCLTAGITVMLGACATQPIDSSFAANPTVVAVYAVDTGPTTNQYLQVTGASTLADVQIWSATEPTKISPMPPSYGGFRVEFDQPIVGKTATNDPNVVWDSTIKEFTFFAAQSFCSPVASAPIQILDTTGATPRSIAASLCYNAASNLGSNPAITLVIGNGAGLAAPAASPFTCQAFTPAQFDGGLPEGLILKPKTQYSLAFTPAGIVSTKSGGTLKAPAGPNSASATWAANSLNFTTSGFAIMAVTFQDPNTGFNSYLKKPFAGYLKDCPEGISACGSNPVGTFAMPSDDTPLQVITTYGYNANADTSEPADTAGKAGVATMTRSDGSSIGARIWNDFGNGFVAADPRIINIQPFASLQGALVGATTGNTGWEPSQSYTLTVKGTLASGDALDTLGTDFTASFKTVSASQSVRSVTPADGTVAQPVYNANRLNVGFPSQIVLSFTAPVDLTSAVAGVTLKDSAGAVVPVTVTLQEQPTILADVYGGDFGDPATLTQGKQIVLVNTTDPLAPGKTYTVSAKGVTVVAGTPGITGKFDDFTSTFATATFRIDSVRRAPINYVNRPERDLLGSSAISIDRATQQPLDLFVNRGSGTANNITLRFTRPVVLDNTKLTVDELKSDGTVATTFTPAQLTVAASSSGSNNPTGLRWRVKISDLTYPIKCNTKFRFTFPTALTSSDTAAATLTAENCTAAGGCPDLRSFTTDLFRPLELTKKAERIQYLPAAGATPESIYVKFNATLDHTSVNTALAAGAFKLYSFDANGNRQTVAITCPALADDIQNIIQCTPNAPLAANSTFQASLVFPTTSPALIAASTIMTELNKYGPYNPGPPAKHTTVYRRGQSAYPADQTSCSYSGSINVNFTTPCAP